MTLSDPGVTLSDPGVNRSDPGLYGVTPGLLQGHSDSCRVMNSHLESLQHHSALLLVTLSDST
jgi:hypothetical protein